MEVPPGAASNEGANHMQRVMILPSVDGQDYAMAVLLDAYVDAELVSIRIASELDVAKTLTSPDHDWTWEDLRKSLQQIPGVELVEIERGPVWDAN